MENKYDPEKCGMMVSPVCDGYGRILSSDDVEVCQTSGGFGLVKEGGKSFDRIGKPISKTLSGG